ncbi:AAA family ATPase [bacterium]|nr:AAA family ATPase [bacterium]
MSITKFAEAALVPTIATSIAGYYGLRRIENRVLSTSQRSTAEKVVVVSLVRINFIVLGYKLLMGLSVTTAKLYMGGVSFVLLGVLDLIATLGVQEDIVSEDSSKEDIRMLRVTSLVVTASTGSFLLMGLFSPLSTLSVSKGYPSVVFIILHVVPLSLEYFSQISKEQKERAIQIIDMVALGVVAVYADRWVRVAVLSIPIIKMIFRGNGSEVAREVFKSGCYSSSLAIPHTEDWTFQANRKRFDPYQGREREMKELKTRLSTGLCSLLVGEKGSGKTAAMESLANDLVDGSVSPYLKGARLLYVNLGSLAATGGYAGRINSHLEAIIDGVKKYPGKVILFMDEGHILSGLGTHQGNSNNDIKQFMKTAMSRKQLTIVVATTLGELKLLEKDPPFMSRLGDPILMMPLSPEKMQEIIDEYVKLLEKREYVCFNEGVVEAICNYTSDQGIADLRRAKHMLEYFAREAREGKRLITVDVVQKRFQLLEERKAYMEKHRDAARLLDPRLQLFRLVQP